MQVQIGTLTEADNLKMGKPAVPTYDTFHNEAQQILEINAKHVTVQQSLPIDDNDLDIDVDEDELALIDQLENEENSADNEDRPYRPETLEDLGNMTIWQHLEFWWDILSGFFINITSSSVG